jgi:hypothetical protein
MAKSHVVLQRPLLRGCAKIAQLRHVSETNPLQIYTYWLAKEMPTVHAKPRFKSPVIVSRNGQ